MSSAVIDVLGNCPNIPFTISTALLLFEYLINQTPSAAIVTWQFYKKFIPLKIGYLEVIIPEPFSFVVFKSKIYAMLFGCVLSVQNKYLLFKLIELKETDGSGNFIYTFTSINYKSQISIVPPTIPTAQSLPHKSIAQIKS